METQLGRPVTDDERRARYAAAIRLLADHFPKDCEERQKQLYFERLMRSNRHPDDVDRAIDRVIDTRQAKSFPPWAVIDERLRDIQKDQRGYHNRPPEYDGERPRLTPAEWAVAIAEIRDFRLDFFPPAQPDISTDQEARRKHLGVKVIPQKLNDELDRNRRERARDRQAKAREKAPPQGEDEGPF